METKKPNGHYAHKMRKEIICPWSEVNNEEDRRIIC